MRRSPRLPLEDLRPYLLDLPGPPPAAPGESEGLPGGVLDWRALFGNDHPVELEVGFGKGLFLLTAAQARPEVNFVGVEILRQYQLFAATRLAKRRLGNVRLVYADARLFLRDRVTTGSVQVLHVYFPDPWWKKRHEKRRVFTPEFVTQCARVLASGGHLLVVTDVEEYSHVIAGLVAQHTTLRPAPPPDPHEPRHDLDYLTNFERKFRKEGRPIHRLAYVRTEEPSIEEFAASPPEAGTPPAG